MFQSGCSYLNEHLIDQEQQRRLKKVDTFIF